VPDKNFSDMSDDEIREMAGAAPSPAAWIAEARDRLEQDILRLALTEASVASGVHGDLRKALAALDAVLELASGAYVMSASFEYGTGRRESVSWDLDPAAVREAITGKLRSEEQGDA
jgi:hypothetical protein